MASPARPQKRIRGEIEVIASGARRVKVYAGVDPVSKKRHYLRETVPAGPNADAEAERVRIRLVNDVLERRNPKTSAKLAHLIDRHLREAHLARKTRDNYRRLVDKHVLPFIGQEKIGSIDADTLDSLYAELHRCREHCRDRAVDHRTAQEHDCNQRCVPHVCKPLGASGIRQIHWILSGAYRRAERLRWITTSPIKLAEPPTRPPSNPKPPAPEQAARILNEAWQDPDWGMFIWLAMVTGQRRGELCAIRWRHLDLERGVLHIEKSIGQLGAQVWEEDTKTHADRRIVLDADTLTLLTEHRQRCEANAAAIGVILPGDAYAFTLAPDGSTHRLPDSVTQKYKKMTQRIDIDTSIHKLRHYSATELILAGVNVRTVAGRLGHSGGGTTTLRTYTAWVSEADQRAAGEMATRMPARPATSSLPERVQIDPKSPYEKIAVELRDRIYGGQLRVGMSIPPIKQLAREHGVSTSTAQRAVRLLDDWGLVRVATGHLTLVQPQPAVEPAPVAGDGASDDVAPHKGAECPLDLAVHRLGSQVATLRTNADPSDAKILHRLLVGAVKRDGGELEAIDEYELVVRAVDDGSVLTTYVAATA